MKEVDNSFHSCRDDGIAICRAENKGKSWEDVDA